MDPIDVIWGKAKGVLLRALFVSVAAGVAYLLDYARATDFGVYNVLVVAFLTFVADSLHKLSESTKEVKKLLDRNFDEGVK